MSHSYKLERFRPDETFAKMFSRGNPAPVVRYGLPKQVEFCQRCVISNQRPSSTVEFSHTVEDEKDTIRFSFDNKPW